MFLLFVFFIILSLVYFLALSEPNFIFFRISFNSVFIILCYFVPILLLYLFGLMLQFLLLSFVRCQFCGAFCSIYIYIDILFKLFYVKYEFLYIYIYIFLFTDYFTSWNFITHLPIYNINSMS